MRQLGRVDDEEQEDELNCYGNDRPLLTESGSVKLVVPTWLNSALARQQQQQQQQHQQQQQQQQHQRQQQQEGEGGQSRGWCNCEDEMRCCLHCSSEVCGDARGSAESQFMERVVDHLPPKPDKHNHLIDETALDADDCVKLQTAGLKAEIVSHPLYEQLLDAHVACLRIATPVDQLPKIDGQLVFCNHITAKYSSLGNQHLLFGNNKDELDQFMSQYLSLLRSFKEKLQHHVCLHAKEAVWACRELECSLLNLTGASPGEGSGEGMSDEEDEQAEYELWQDDLGFGPLVPSETERTLMERVRQELKDELKQGYRARIADVREEILRKRRAGKLPGDTTSVLKAWWHAHSKWPYPTEDEKTRLVQETGLELKQINNWFINQRKRNWHQHSASATSLKAKSKR